MLDPRIEIMEMMHELRMLMMAMEEKISTIPHEAEPVEEYEHVYHAPVEGDYIHPMTPSHPCPEGFGEGAYWDEVYQCWMMPNHYEEDVCNLSTNLDTDMTWSSDNDSWEHMPENDWSNDYDVFMDEVEEMEEEMHEEAPMTEEVNTESGFVSPMPTEEV